MKKIIPYLVALLTIIAITYLVIKKDKSVGALPDSTKIVVENLNDIQKIFLVDMKGNEITLKKDGNKWLLNDSLLPRTDALQNILDAINAQTATQAVAKPAQSFVLKDLSTEGIKVEVYNPQNKKIRSFYVGGQTLDGSGTYMLNDGTNEPYIYQIPGFPYALTSRYFTNLEDWRSRSALDFADSTIKKIEVKYTLFPDSSFTILHQNNNYIFESKIKLEAKIGKMQSYLKLFHPMYCAGYEDQNPLKDSIIKRAPSYGSIAITTNTGEETVLHLLYHEITQRTKTGKNYKGISYDPDFMYAYTNKNFMLLAVSNYQNIFCSPSSFYK